METHALLTSSGITIPMGDQAYPSLNRVGKEVVMFSVRWSWRGRGMNWFITMAYATMVVLPQSGCANRTGEAPATLKPLPKVATDDHAQNGKSQGMSPSSPAGTITDEHAQHGHPAMMPVSYE